MVCPRQSTVSSDGGAYSFAGDLNAFADSSSESMSLQSCVTCGPLYSLSPGCADLTQQACAAIGAVEDGCCARDCCTLNVQSMLGMLIVSAVLSLATCAVSLAFFMRSAAVLYAHRLGDPDDERAALGPSAAFPAAVIVEQAGPRAAQPAAEVELRALGGAELRLSDDELPVATPVAARDGGAGCLDAVVLRSPRAGTGGDRGATPETGSRQPAAARAATRAAAHADATEAARRREGGG